MEHIIIYILKHVVRKNVLSERSFCPYGVESIKLFNSWIWQEFPVLIDKTQKPFAGLRQRKCFH